jgi:hypothetical protein
VVAFIVTEAKLKNIPVNLAWLGQYFLFNVNWRYVESKPGIQDFGIHLSMTVFYNLHHKGDTMISSSDIRHRKKREQIVVRVEARRVTSKMTS